MMFSSTHLRMAVVWAVGVFLLTGSAFASHTIKVVKADDADNVTVDKFAYDSSGTWVTVDANSSRITYAGGTWVNGSCTNSKTSTTDGAYAQLTFNGAGIKWYSTGAGWEIVEIFIDGISQGSLEGPETGCNSLGYQKTGLSSDVAPAITTQPSNQTVTAGQTATFSVTATGTPTPTYQWKKNGTAITSATSASYTTPATASGDNGAQFTCVVTNSVNSVTSNTATLTVNWAPTVTTQPANQTVTAGQTATFTVVASANPAPTYQWKKNGTTISAATSASYTTPATVSADNGAQFTCVVTNSVNNVTTNAATLTVNWAPSITTQPENQTVTAGQTATFTIAATGNPTPSYQWKKNGSDISSATSASYTTPATVAGDNAAQFTCFVSNSVSNVTSATAVLTVNSAPTITTQPQSATICNGHTVNFTCAATGSPAPTYQWKKNGTNITGATGTQYTSVWDDDEDGSVFTCVATNSVGSTPSSAATLNYNYEPAFSQGPKSKTVAVGDAVTFNFTLLAGTSPLTYQWYHGTSPISGGTSATYTIASAQTSHAGKYSCTVTNMCEDVSSGEATLTVGTGVAAYEYPENCGEGENMKVDGKIVVGNVTNPTAALEVGGVGDIKCAKLKINDWTIRPADFVFDAGHSMLDLNQLESFIEANKHLPNVQSGPSMKKDGVDITEMNMALLRTVEEMTLRMIEQNKKIEAQEKKIEEMQKKLK